MVDTIFFVLDTKVNETINDVGYDMRAYKEITNVKTTPNKTSVGMSK